MDGVIYHGNRLLDGVLRFVEWLQSQNKQFIFLTNSSERATRELAQKLARMGLTVDESHFYTSALATASFLKSQAPPGSSVYVIGEPGLFSALYDAGFVMNEVNPDYVIVGETRSYSYEKIECAIRLVLDGAKLIATNPDITGPTENGIAPACRALVAPIELSTGKSAYYVGKPNPLMMRHALKRLGVSVADTAIIGDRMDTDIIAGIESEIDTVLVLSGVTTREGINQFPYRPHYVLKNVGEIPG
ncbi:MAG: HAD-IIA family hydrolase [Oscillospiraceae bacterium]|jgi:NagD protein|nr:HAD-IIA family hydrolase [Oscillospiraceae bacterium]